MPRDGSGNYSQPFPPVESGTEIESAVYNGFTSDVVNDMNTARPIVAGGTGATNAADALDELGGEQAQQVVTNYNSHVFNPGSFYSSTSATAGPIDGHAFSGICYITDDDNLFIEARDHDDTAVPARKYVREKDAGVWGLWSVEGATIAGDNTKVVFTGTGTVGVSNTNADMFYGVTGTAPSSSFIVNTESDASGTNAFQVSKTGVATFKETSGSSVIYLNKSGSTKEADISGLTNSLLRWTLRLGNGTAESGSNAGSNFQLFRFDDAGTTATQTMAIDRATGNVSFNNNVGVGGTFGVTGTTSLSGALSVTGVITALGGVSATQLTGTSPGTVWQLKLQDSASGHSKYLRTVTGGTLEILNNAFSAAITTISDAGAITAASTITTLAKTNQFGSNGGTTTTGAVTQADANILLYGGGAGNNWCGLGADGSGNLWVRTGNSGTPAPAFYIQASDQTVVAPKLTSPSGSFSAATSTVWSANTPLCTETATSAIWPFAVKGNDRGILSLATATSSIAHYFTQGTIANNVGAINCGTTTTAYATSSDGRKKPLREAFSGLEIVNRLNPVKHNWINEPEQWSYGVIAQEAVEVLPQMITRGDDDIARKAGDDGFMSWGADYSQAVPVLLRAVQELSAMNAQLMARIEALGSEMTITAIVLQLVVLHGLDGREILINPEQVTSVVSKAGPNKALADKAECLINLADGKFITVVEDCVIVRRRLEEARQ